MELYYKEKKNNNDNNSNNKKMFEWVLNTSEAQMFKFWETFILIICLITVCQRYVLSSHWILLYSDTHIQLCNEKAVKNKLKLRERK